MPHTVVGGEEHAPPLLQRLHSLLVSHFHFSTIHNPDIQTQTDYQSRDTNVEYSKELLSPVLESESVGGVSIIVGDEEYISPGAGEVLIVTQFSPPTQFQSSVIF